MAASYSASSSGGSLAAGTYYVCITGVDANGIESMAWAGNNPAGPYTTTGSSGSITVHTPNHPAYNLYNIYIGPSSSNTDLIANYISGNCRNIAAATDVVITSQGFYRRCNQQPSRYMGPSIAAFPSTVAGGNDTQYRFKAGTDKIYIRLDNCDPDALLANSVGDYSLLHNVYPTIANNNPNSSAIYITNVGGFGMTISGSYVSLENVTIQNYQTAVKLTGTQVRLYGSTLYFGYWGVSKQNAPAATIESCLIDGQMRGNNTFMPYDDVKGFRLHADRMRKNAIILSNGSNLRLANSTIRGVFDGILGPSIHDVEIHGCTFDNVWDDAWQMVASCYRINIHHNFFFGAGISHDSAGNTTAVPDEDKLYLHHNVFHPGAAYFFYGRKGSDCPERNNDGYEGMVHGVGLGKHDSDDQNVGHRNPWKFYYNTVIIDSDPIGPYFNIQPFGYKRPFLSGTHEVFNNIFMARVKTGQSTLLGQDFGYDDGGTIFDGNVYYYNPYQNLHWRFLWNLSTGVSTPVGNGTANTNDTIIKMRAVTNANTMTYYAPGWEASGIDIYDTQPVANITYKPVVASCNTGAVNLTANGLNRAWPGLTTYEPWRGAIAP